MSVIMVRWNIKMCDSCLHVGVAETAPEDTNWEMLSHAPRPRHRFRTPDPFLYYKFLLFDKIYLFQCLVFTNNFVLNKKKKIRLKGEKLG